MSNITTEKDQKQSDDIDSRNCRTLGAIPRQNPTIPEMLQATNETAQATNNDTLSDDERTDFHMLHDTVVTGARWFVKAGLAFLEIRSRQLYREEYGSFENYRKNIQGVSAQYLANLLNAAELYVALESRNTDGSIYIPEIESQFRPLMKLASFDEQVEVLKSVKSSSGEKPITAKVIQGAVNEKLKPGYRPKVTPKQKLSTIHEILSDLNDVKYQETQSLIDRINEVIA
jgi:hypothetical protein